MSATKYKTSLVQLTCLVEMRFLCKMDVTVHFICAGFLETYFELWTNTAICSGMNEAFTFTVESKDGNCVKIVLFSVFTPKYAYEQQHLIKNALPWIKF